MVVRSAFRAIPSIFGLLCEADTAVMKPFRGAIFIVTSNHLTKRHAPAGAIHRLDSFNHTKVFFRGTAATVVISVVVVVVVVVGSSSIGFTKRAFSTSADMRLALF